MIGNPEICQDTPSCGQDDQTLCKYIFFIILQVAVEYDCSDHGSLGPINFGYDYCVHVLARHPKLSQEKVEEVIAFAGNFFHFCRGPFIYYVITFLGFLDPPM